MCYRQPYTTSTSTPPLYTQAYTCDMAVVQTLLQQQQQHPQLQPHQQQAATTRAMPLTGFVMSRAPGSGGDGAVYLLPSTTTAATTATTAGGAIGVGGMSATMMPTPPLCLPPAALNNVAAELTAVRVMGMQSRQPMSVSDGNGSGGLSLSCTPARPAFVQPAPSTTTTTAAAMSTGEYTAYSGRVTVGHPRVPPSLSLCATAPPPQPPAAAATATTTTSTGTIGVSARPTVSAVRLLAPTMCATTLGSCNNNNNNGCGTAGGSGQGLATHTPQPAPTTTASHFFAAHTMNSGDSGAVHAALLTPTPTTHHNGSVAAVAPYTSSTKLDDSPTSMCSTVLCTHPSTPFAPHMSVSGQSSGTGSTVAAASVTGRGGGGAATTMTTVSTPTAATNADPSATTATFAKSPFGASSITLYPVDPSMLLPFANGASFLAIPSSMANASFLTLTTTNAAPAAPPSQTTTTTTSAATNTTTATAAAATAPTTSLAMPMTSNMTTTTAPVASSLPPHAASAPAASMMPTTMVHVDTHSDAAGQMTLAALQRNLTTHYGTHAVYVSQPNTPAPATALLTTMSPSMYDAAAPTTRAHVTAMTPTMVPASALHFAPVFAKGQPQQQQPQQLRYAQLQPQTQQASQPAGQLPLLGVRGFVAPPPVGYRHVPHTTLITSVPPLALPLVRPGRVPAMVLC